MATIEARSAGPRDTSGTPTSWPTWQKNTPSSVNVSHSWKICMRRCSLLTFCAATKANYWLRTIPREFAEDYAAMHARSVTKCLEKILHVDDIPPAHLGIGIHAIVVHGRIGSGWSSEDVRCGTLGQLGLLFRNGQKTGIPTSPTQF